jgi:hypothetical protein
VRFEWDARKAQLNLRKHRVDFADAATVFEDERALTMPDTLSVDEERWITLGMDALGRILGRGVRVACGKHSADFSTACDTSRTRSVREQQ